MLIWVLQGTQCPTTLAAPSQHGTVTPGAAPGPALSPTQGPGGTATATMPTSMGAMVPPTTIRHVAGLWGSWGGCIGAITGVYGHYNNSKRGLDGVYRGHGRL